MQSAIKGCMTTGKNILITSGRSPITLDMARKFSAAGHKVFVTETSRFHLCTFSNSVEKTFVIPSPRFKPASFIEALLGIVESEKIDFLIPNWEEILNISLNLKRFPKSCEVFCSPFELMHTLHSKALFIERLASLGLKTPKTILVKCQEDLEKLDFDAPYVLKPCYSRASQKIRKVSPPQVPLDLEFEPHNPWVAQEWLEGEKYCSYSICHEGEIKAHGLYPVEYSIDGNSCLTFKSMEHEGIYRWIAFFVKSQKFTGQVGFDFIVTNDGSIYAIECNPRSTSGAHLFAKEDKIETAFLNTTKEPIFPHSSISRQIAAGMLMYGWKTLPPKASTFSYLWKLVTSKDVVFELKDLAPFLAQPFLGIKYVMASKWLQHRMDATFYADLDWNGEAELFTPATQERKAI